MKIALLRLDVHLNPNVWGILSLFNLPPRIVAVDGVLIKLSAGRKSKVVEEVGSSSGIGVVYNKKTGKAKHLLITAKYYFTELEVLGIWKVNSVFATLLLPDSLLLDLSGKEVALPSNNNKSLRASFEVVYDMIVQPNEVPMAWENAVKESIRSIDSCQVLNWNWKLITS